MSRRSPTKTLYVWLIMVLIISVYPFGPVRTPVTRIDLVFHFLIYAITGALFFVTLSESRLAFIKRIPGLLAVLLASVYGLAMELVQARLPRRTFSISDAAANAMGAGAAVLLIMYLRRRAAAPEQGGE